MAWIELHQELPEHPKLVAFATEAKLDPDTAVGKLMRLWLWALSHAEDGDLSVFPRPVIARAMNVPTDRADDLWKALQTPAKAGGSGFVDSDGKLHDWMDYVGRLIRKRREDSDRKKGAKKPRSRRVPKELQTHSDGIPAEVTRKPDGARTEVHTHSDVTVPYRTVPNQKNLPGEAAVSGTTPNLPAKPTETAGASRPVPTSGKLNSNSTESQKQVEAPKALPAKTPPPVPSQSHGKPPPLTPSEIDDWNIAAEAIRRRGWQEPSLRRVLRWALTEPKPTNLDLFLLRLVAVVFDTQAKSEDPNVSKDRINDQAAYVIGWMQTSAGPPSEPALRVARQNIDRVRAEKTNGTKMKDFVAALMQAWDERL